MFGFAFRTIDALAEASELTLIAGGDVMMGRYIGKVIRRGEGRLLFKEVAPLFKKADVVFCNLESVFGIEGDRLVFPEKLYNFKASTGSVKVLANVTSDRQATRMVTFVPMQCGRD